jgi:hypothetical protein
LLFIAVFPQKPHSQPKNDDSNPMQATNINFSYVNLGNIGKLCSPEQVNLSCSCSLYIPVPTP